jgi:hypothetical protein
MRQTDVAEPTSRFGAVKEFGPELIEEPAKDLTNGQAIDREFA